MKVYWNGAFEARLPLSNIPVSLVTVCAVISLFVQVTVVPAVTVMAGGDKAKFSIVTALVDTGGGIVAGLGAHPEETAARIMASMRRTAGNLYRMLPRT